MMNLTLPVYRLGLSAWLIGTCAALAALALLELARPDPTAAPIAARVAGAPARPPAASDSVLPALDTLTEVVARPLFLPLRRPVPSAGAQAAQPAAQFMLAGIVIIDGHPVAFIQSGTSPPPVMVSLGGTIGGWTVTAIERDRVVLRSGDSTAELSLRDNPLPYRMPAPNPVPQRPTQR